MTDTTITTTPAVVTATAEERQQALNAYVTNLAAQGWRVVSQSATNAQLVKGKPTNHVLHLILSIITLGVWLIVWALVAILSGQKEKLVTVDPYGVVHVS